MTPIKTTWEDVNAASDAESKASLAFVEARITQLSFTGEDATDVVAEVEHAEQTYLESVDHHRAVFEAYKKWILYDSGLE